MSGKRSSTKGFKKPLASRTKTNRIRKGQSSSANPNQRKFRDEAKSKVFGFGAFPSKGGGTLTVEQLQQHNGCAHDEASLVGEADAQDRLSIAETESNHTAESDWTLGSILTMNKLLHKWDPASALHKEMLAMYNASTEIIKSKGGQQTDTEYFAVLMTTLEAVEADISRTSAAALLAIFAKRVPAAVLRKKFSWITTMCINFMQSYAQSTHVMLLRNLLCLLSSCLKTLDLATWSESSTLQVFSFMFPYIVHSRPKLRKFAQKAICNVLTGSSIMAAADAPLTHPAVPALVAFCLPIVKSSAATSLPVSTLHIFGFLKLVLHLFPQAEVKATCEAVLQVMGAGHPTVVRCGLVMLQSFFSSRPRPAVALSPELNAQLVNALYDYKPGLRDHKLYDVWLVTVQEALANLESTSAELFLSNLPKFVGIIVDSWHSGRSDTSYTAAMVLMTLLKQSFQACLDKEGNTSCVNSLCHTTGVKVVEHMQRALHYQFASVWDQVLLTWATCFEVLGKKCATDMLEPLSQIAELRESQAYSNSATVDRTIATAVKAMGPELVLKAIPLDMSEEEGQDFKRSWMLPVLRDNIRATRLAFFTTYFLPLASAFHELAEAPDKPTSVTKAYEILERQIWSLLPGFCTSPTDFNESFPRIARTLGTYLVNRLDLRLDIMSALRRLISSNILNEENVPEMSRYAKNFLPILFNIYTNEAPSQCEEGTRLAAYDTIKAFVRIADDQLCSALFISASAKLLDEQITSHSKHAILDLARSLVSKMGPENIQRMYMLSKVNLEDSDRRVQKKAYRVLEEICHCPTPICKEFIETHVAELGELLLDSLQSIAPGSRAPRLRCLVLLLGNLSIDHKSFAWTALHEAVLCTKVNAAKVRQAAYEVVLTVGKALIRWQPEDPGAAIKELVSQLTAGFTGGSYLVSCTILALSTALYEFKGIYSNDVLNAVVEAVEIVMASHNREIVQAALYFVRMLFVILSTEELAQHLTKLIPNLCSMSEDCRKHFRMKLRDIFVKLIRKFGYENIIGLLPEPYRKLAVKIRKVEKRKKRKKDEKSREYQSKEKHDDDVASSSGILGPSGATEGIEQILQDSSEDESDDSDEKIPASRKGKKAAPAWIEEQGEDDIVDFLDKSAGKQILSTDPKAPPKSKGKCPFEMTEDGRLLILDPEAGKVDKDEPASDTEEAANDLLEALSHYKTKKRKAPLDTNGGEGTSGAGSGTRPSKKKKTDKTSDGDARKGKLEPYAYVPLNRMSLNKRFKKKPAAFKRLLSAAQKGARKGQKTRAARVMRGAKCNK
ncbi:RRP12-like protein [Dermacentor variabilis]|uniref:RRP12-like protein n=1 Tax=Dermacentor variabilis TaxID=34621 RepID=UPI003F5CABB5